MHVLELTPMLYTRKLEETVAFYTTVLGFQCEALHPEWGWARVSQGRVSVMFAHPHDHAPFDKPVFTGSLYFRTGDVDALWAQLRTRAEVRYPIENFEYGMREFAIYDNNGYLLQFGQELPAEAAGAP